jgi:serine/threonine protein kinase
VVRTHDLGENSGIYYITMEYVEGKSLKDLIRSRGKLPLAITLSVGKQLARALEVAHEQGVIHRDIKPQNMVVEPDGVLKVMDFGIARLASRQPESGVTQAGTAIGTPEYMSPEQLAGKEIDARADIYAAGCVLYECLTGRPPFTAETPYQLVAKLLEETAPTPRSINPEVPVALDALVMQALAKDASGRPQTALILHDRLAQIG